MNKRGLFGFTLGLFLISPAAAQEIEPVPGIVEQQLENLTETNEDQETEDDFYLQQLEHYLKDPLNLNTATPEMLYELRLLSPLQITNFYSYKRLLGDLVTIYELQAIPYWDITTIKKIAPFVTISSKLPISKALHTRLKGGDHSILFRVSEYLEKQKGYLLDSSTARNFYPGSRQKVLLRYKYQFKNLLQYGITGEKDAGEQFFKGKQSAGFDFYSVNFFARNLGIIKRLALGDFSVNFGQGLTIWQSLAFKKSSDVTNIKRQGEILRPYNSANEILFQRGAGITIGKRNWEVTGFASYKKIDANLVTDTVISEEYVTSLQMSGYHRTASELEDRRAQSQLSFGGNFSLNTDKLHLGVNAVHYQFGQPIHKADNLYNKYAVNGKYLRNFSIDYSYTFRNLHFFGEAATSTGRGKAFVNGLLINMDANVAMSFLYRNISPEYQSLYTNAFTENTYPTNEHGFFSGITISPTSFLRLDAYIDFFKFPWLKFRVDAPSHGSEYLVQATYHPGKNLDIYARYRYENKGANYNPGREPLNPVVYRPKQNLRIQGRFKLSRSSTFRSRSELLWFDKGNMAETGMLIFADYIYKPLLKPYSGNLRLQYFNTDSYNSRLYAYENDVLYNYAIPVFYDKGVRWYFNFNFDFTKYLSVWLRVAQTIYEDKSGIGSGLDYIAGNHRTEVKVQALMSF